MAKIKRFRWKGSEYQTLSTQPTLGELRYVERETGLDYSDWTQMTAAAAGYFFAIRRGQLAAGETPLVTWAEIENATLDDFEDVKDPEPLPAPEPPQIEVLPPESEWAVDPTVAGIPMAPSVESGPHQYSNPAPVTPWMTEGGNFSGNSPSYSGGPQR